MLNWNQLATLGIFSAVIHWVVARAKITKPFWELSWLPIGREFVDGLLSCAACSGWWIGLGLGWGMRLTPFLTGSAFWDVIGAGIAGVFVTPLVESMLLWGLNHSKI
jgi:hypothetical protein